MSFEKFDLTKKTALITGAGGLLGIEHAAALLESGAQVVLTDLRQETLSSVVEELSKLYEPSRILIKTMDVSQLTSIKDAAQSLWQSGIRIDILINNAAIDPKVKGETGIIETSRLEHFSLGQWNDQLAVGLTGAFLCSQTFGNAMAQDGKGGVILNIASDLSVIAPDQRLYRKDNIEEKLQPVKPVTYSVVKTGLIGLTRYVAVYWANKNVRCNALSPGGVLSGQSEEFVHRLSGLIPMERMASKDEYRSALQFLCSDASSYMTGQNLIIDGGRTVL